MLQIIENKLIDFNRLKQAVFRLWILTQEIGLSEVKFKPNKKF